MPAHRTNETDGALRTGELEVARGPPTERLVLTGGHQLGQAFGTRLPVDDLEQLLAADHIVGTPAAAVRSRAFAHGHVLNEADVQRTVDGELREGQIILMQLAHRDRVDLHGVEPGGQRGVDAVEGLLQIPATRDGVELLGIERVQRDVHTRKPCLTQLVGHARQQHAVGGERDVLDAGRVVDVAHQVDHALAHQRLAAGQAHAFDAQVREHANHVRDLLDTQDIGMAHGLHALFRHAVDATVVATVRQRYTQVIDGAAVSVLHEVPSRFRIPSVPRAK